MTRRAERRPHLEAIGRFVYNRYRNAAMRAVASAIRDGRLVPPATLLCEDCGQSAECYDHRHYDQPLTVAPVCWRCNLKRGMGALDHERIGLDLSPFWGDGDVDAYAKLLGFELEDEDVA